MALGYERAHAEFFSKSESLMIVVFSFPNTRRTFVHPDLSNHPESIRLATLFFALTGQTSKSVRTCQTWSGLALISTMV